MPYSHQQGFKDINKSRGKQGSSRARGPPSGSRLNKSNAIYRAQLQNPMFNAAMRDGSKGSAAQNEFKDPNDFMMMNFTQTQNASQFAGPPSQSVPREGTVDLLALVNQINQQERQIADQEHAPAVTAERGEPEARTAAQESQEQLENLQLKSEGPADRSQR